MNVTIEPHIGKNIATGEMVDVGQYRIRVDGLQAGYVGYRAGSRICLFRKFGPVETKEIESQVSALLERDSTSTQAPDVPAELMQTKMEAEEVLDDDFDA